jgi:hypothetical protein
MGPKSSAIRQGPETQIGSAINERTAYSFASFTYVPICAVFNDAIINLDCLIVVAKFTEHGFNTR